MERSGARALSPSAKGVRGGALVGDTTARAKREIRFPEDLLRRHHLYVARTRIGKSTLMHHIVAHKMMEKAAGRDGDAIVVVDPHADLVGGLLRHVPESLIDKVRLIDLADKRGYPGVNLLDTRIFSDRDRTADSVVRIAKGLWDQWGPRMQSILEQTVKTLHEANDHPATADDEQFTILDALTLLADDKFKTGVLTLVRDPYLTRWWGRDFAGWRGETKADALAPVQTRLSYYASSKTARAILGQPRSTIDMRRVIREGGILLVSTAQGTVGRDVAALVGASLLNLVDAVIREQGSLPPEQRRGALVVVDEMQSMPGVDYESMLSELGKFGASFILATQSLAKLDDLSRTMRDTILANVGCLAVFQVAGNDARQLVWEMGKDRVSEDDIVSLPVHQCYVRATVGTERMPAFSMGVREPEEGGVPSLRSGFWRAPRPTPPRLRTSLPRTLRSRGWRRSIGISWNGRKRSSIRMKLRCRPAPATERWGNQEPRGRSRARGTGAAGRTVPATARQRMNEGEGTGGIGRALGHALPRLPGDGRPLRLVEGARSTRRSANWRTRG